MFGFFLFSFFHSFSLCLYLFFFIWPLFRGILPFFSFFTSYRRISLFIYREMCSCVNEKKCRLFYLPIMQERKRKREREKKGEFDFNAMITRYQFQHGVCGRSLSHLFGFTMEQQIKPLLPSDFYGIFMRAHECSFMSCILRKYSRFFFCSF